MKTEIDFNDLKNLMDPKMKTIKLSFGFDPSSSNLETLINLSKTFNKTVVFDLTMGQVKIAPESDLQTIFARCQEIESKPRIYRPEKALARREQETRALTYTAPAMIA